MTQKAYGVWFSKSNCKLSISKFAFGAGEHCSLGGKQVFYPTAIKVCRGIVFTNGIRSDKRPGGSGKSLFGASGCISETSRYIGS